MKRKFAVLILLFLLCFLQFVEAAKKKKQGVDKIPKEKKEECLKNVCGHLGELLNERCYYQCVSKECYFEVFGPNGIEFGENTKNKELTFGNCVQGKK